MPPAAGRPVRTGGVEVVEHVERAELHVATDARGGQVGRPGVAERGDRRAFAGHPRGRLELPGAVAVVEDHRLVQRGLGADPDRVGRGQPGQWRRLVGRARVVEAGAVVEDHTPCRVVGDHGRDRRGVLGVRDVRRLPQLGVTGGQADLAEGVGVEVVGHQEVVGRSEQLSLVRLTGRLGGRVRRHQRGHRVVGVGEHHDAVGGRGQLGLARELHDGSRHLDQVADRGVRGGQRGSAEDEDAVGGSRRGVGAATGPGGLHVEAVEAAGRVDRGHDTLRLDGVTEQRAHRGCPCPGPRRWWPW